MDTENIVWLSIRQLKDKKVRTALTVLMVVIGVASIVALTSETAGAAQNIQSTLGSLGPTSILVTPANGQTFTDADIAQLQSLPNVSSVIPIVTGSAVLSVNGYNTSVTVLGVSVAGLNTILGGNATLYQGSMYQDTSVPAMVLGNSAAYASSTDSSMQTAYVGQTGELGISSGPRSSTKTYIPIVGILPSHSSFLVPVDSAAIVSMPLAEVILHKTSFNEILVEANSAQNVSGVSSLISTVYGSKARVLNAAQFASNVASIVGSTSLLFIIIGGISLLVAAIGIMNVMLMAVSERMHDIGILKAIGFRSRDVMFVFLLQAVAIGLIGGLVGLGAGMATSYSMYALSSGGTPSGGIGPASSTGAHFSGGAGGAGIGSGPHTEVFISNGQGGSVQSGGSKPSIAGPSGSSGSSIKPVFTAPVILEALTIAVVISIIAGIYPAWKASKMEPIDALKIL